MYLWIQIHVWKKRTIPVIWSLGKPNRRTPSLNLQSRIDQRGTKLFYFNNVSGDLNTDEMIALRTEIDLYLRNVNNRDNKNYFLERERDFEKYFRKKECFWNMKIQRTLSITSSLNCNNNLILLEETKKQIFIENEEKRCSRRYTIITMMLAL